VRHIGFSTHGPTEVILNAIDTGEFSYVNLHWYYFDQRNFSAVLAAQKQDMGLFIISPSDKGGQLYTPPDKLQELCAPLSPMGFNDLFCLSHPEVHTLSIGASKPTDFDAHLAILDALDDTGTVLPPIKRKLQDALREAFDPEWAEHWHRGLPLVVQDEQLIPIYHVVRMFNMAKAYDMIEFGKYRYNLLNNGGHWFPGDKLTEAKLHRLPEILKDYQFADRIPGILAEAHALFDSESSERLSAS
jgi:predicted aldo/keto reductase-like oxidoreductase